MFDSLLDVQHGMMTSINVLKLIYFLKANHSHTIKKMLHAQLRSHE